VEMQVVAEVVLLLLVQMLLEQLREMVVLD
jgi:hypothetical protein